MGVPMAGHLLDAGHSLTIFNRTRERGKVLLDRGAAWADTPAQVADGSEVVFTMVGYPSDVEESYLGKQGIFSSARSGTVAVDMTTSSPALARRLAEEGAKKGVGVLDAPVSGGDVGARNAALSIMVGGGEGRFWQDQTSV